MSLKEEYIAELRAQVDAWSSEIDRWSKKIGRLDPHLKVIYEERLDLIKGKREEARRKIGELERVSGHDLEEALQCGAEMMWSHFRESMHQMREMLKKRHHAAWLLGTPHKHVYDASRFAMPSGTHRNASRRGSQASRSAA